MLGRRSLRLGLCVMSFGRGSLLLFSVVLDLMLRRLSSRGLSGFLRFCLPLHTTSATFSAFCAITTTTTATTRFAGLAGFTGFAFTFGCSFSRRVLGSGVLSSICILRLLSVFFCDLLVKDFVDICFDDTGFFDTTIFFENMHVDVRIVLLVSFKARFNVSGLFKGLLLLRLALFLLLCFAARLLFAKFALSLLLNAATIPLTTFAILFFRLLDFFVVLLSTRRGLVPLEGFDALVLIGSAEFVEIVLHFLSIVLHFDAKSEHLFILQKRVNQFFSDLQ